MLTRHQRSISLSLVCFDLPVWSVVESEATLYERDSQRFHVLLTEPVVYEHQAIDDGVTAQGNPLGVDSDAQSFPSLALPSFDATPRLLWFEISPSRVIMTMQGNGRFSYRHFWERGVYGLSRYWLQQDRVTNTNQIRLRNFTQQLSLTGLPLPDKLQIEYELWANRLCLGNYVLNLEFHD